MDDENQRARKAREGCPYLNTKQAAYHLGISHHTLKTMRHRGRGPACRLHGGTWRYHIDELDAWSNAGRKGGDNG